MSEREYRVLVADPIADAGVAQLRLGASVDVRTGLSPAELLAIIPDYDALVVRSETKVTADVMVAGSRLRVVARAGVGVDNIDVRAATEHGIVVINSPEGNTMAAAEHTVALLMAQSRKIPDAVASLRAGEWKRGKFLGVEVCNKTIGVVGFGKIGREVARRCLGLGMKVLASDAFVTAELVRREGAELVELAELFRRADYITVHTPLNRETRGMLGPTSFSMMKDGVRILNCARGGIIDESALLAALNSGKVAGAALDVFEQEPPPPDHPLLRHPNVIATPHLGASTEEAQVNVAVDVAEQILAVLQGQPPRTAVNLPALSAEAFARLEPYLHLGQRVGRLHGQLLDGPATSVAAFYSGDLLDVDVQPITRSVLAGLLQPMLDENVNLVNAPYLAEQRGIRVTEGKTAGEDGDYSNYLRVEVESAGGRHVIGATVLGRRDLRIRSIDDFNIDLRPEGYLILARHTDRPGVIGRVGTLLGQANINIGGMYVGREAIGKRAIMALTVDEPVQEALLTAIRTAMDADSVHLVDL